MSGNNLVDVIDGDPELSTFARLVKLGGAVQVLQTENPYFTVFAPSNAAFEELPDGYLDKLEDPANKDLLTAVVTYHITEERMPEAGVPTAVFEALYGNDLNLGQARREDRRERRDGGAGGVEGQQRDRPRHRPGADPAAVVRGRGAPVARQLGCRVDPAQPDAPPPSPAATQPVNSYAFGKIFARSSSRQLPGATPSGLDLRHISFTPRMQGQSLRSSTEARRHGDGHCSLNAEG